MRVFRNSDCTNHEDFELVGYFDSDYTSNLIDRKSTTSNVHVLGQSVISWPSRKLNYAALSITEAEYSALGSCYDQALWMTATLQDFGLNYKKVLLRCDNKGAINFRDNLLYHSCSKHERE